MFKNIHFMNGEVQFMKRYITFQWKTQIMNGEVQFMKTKNTGVFSKGLA